LVLHLRYGERANLKALARHGPGPLASQHYRRLWWAASWGTKTWLWWFADQALQAFPPPAHGGLSRVGDRPLQGTRGPTPPVAQNTRLRQPHPYVFGCRLVMLRAHWGVDRLPVEFALVRRQGDPGDQTANARLRQRLHTCRRPAWGQKVVVVAEAADASRVNLTALQELGSWDVIALPRTWKFTNGKARKALVTHLPRWW
jgi:hypothetical protein